MFMQAVRTATKVKNVQDRQIKCNTTILRAQSGQKHRNPHSIITQSKGIKRAAYVKNSARFLYLAGDISYIISYQNSYTLAAKCSHRTAVSIRDQRSKRSSCNEVLWRFLTI